MSSSLLPHHAVLPLIDGTVLEISLWWFVTDIAAVISGTPVDLGYSIRRYQDNPLRDDPFTPRGDSRHRLHDLIVNMDAHLTRLSTGGCTGIGGSRGA